MVSILKVQIGNISIILVNQIILISMIKQLNTNLISAYFIYHLNILKPKCSYTV